MMTGDSKETAIAIAGDVHILPQEEEGADAGLSSCAFTGAEFFSKEPAEQLDLLRTGNKVSVHCNE